ncbi:hypothetical protein SADUNF_Sadunf14G0072100 [Salix dunnii]|uniref:Uncharacterized protein n=1 Tax=Salix dunnii TaxID=1413687 RepID=A0A835MM74_9ROSI|nr:hypothetical protein SADUNF_Sadunf14G0072100 [Salix dunnii]
MEIRIICRVKMEILTEEEDQFFDTREDITSVSDSGSECPENMDSDLGVIGSLPGSIGFEAWIENPGCISERRNKFLKWMGLDADQTGSDDPGNATSNEVEVQTDRIVEHSGAVLGSYSFDDRFSSSRSSMSCWSNDTQELLDGALEDGCRIRNLDNGAEFILDKIRLDGMSERIREVGSNRLLTVAEFERSLGFSPLVQQVMRREVEGVATLVLARKQVKMGWLRRLGAVACIVDRQVEAGDIKPNGGARNQIVRVKSHKKRSKEFSALYLRQDIPAHDGSILTMKFSPDGEDGVVRVWQVMESERSDEFGILDIDSSHAYVTFKDLHELDPHNMGREKKGKFKRARTSHSARVIFPHKTNQSMSFLGTVEISWTSHGQRTGISCHPLLIKLFACGKWDAINASKFSSIMIMFNPVDENYFISGSIDGKVRIWTIPGCQVVDWTDITEIVTALCYRPDGKGGIVGSMTGSCRFYDAPGCHHASLFLLPSAYLWSDMDVLCKRQMLEGQFGANWCILHGSDNRMQQHAQICMQGKKKSPFKRITGFEFSPSDPTRVMVTSADSQVRILHGVDVICKYRGLRNAGSQISASFTSDGMRTVSASKDSNVYIWNHISQDGPVAHVKSKWCCEHIFSNNVSVAIPWCGVISGNSNTINCSENSVLLQSDKLVESSQCKLPLSSPDNFSLGHGLFSHSMLRGSATWPEENLPASSSIVSSAMCRSQYKFLKMSCQNMNGSRHALGLVIVTAGWDGRIKSFQNYGLPPCQLGYGANTAGLMISQSAARPELSTIHALELVKTRVLFGRQTKTSRCITTETNLKSSTCVNHGGCLRNQNCRVVSRRAKFIKWVEKSTPVVGGVAYEDEWGLCLFASPWFMATAKK